MRLRHARERELGFPVGQYLQPAPMLFTRDGHNVFLGDMHRGRAAFLICSGPSLRTQDLTPLQERGFLTMAVNNAATIIRPNLWCSVDDPRNFCDVIWRDPGILKFVPLCHMEKPFSVRDEQGALVDSRERVGDMPGVFGFRRNEAFVAEQFLTEDTFNWGNHGNRTDALGHKGSRSVMLPALRLLYFLGIRQVYLLGCDFRMDPGTSNYAFEQDRSLSSVRGNNQTYRVLNSRFRQLLPRFEAAGFHVSNCTPDSGLTAFPMLDYEEAIRAVRETMPQRVITANMYDRNAQSQATVSVQTPIASAESREAPLDQDRLAELTLVVPLHEGDCRRLDQTWFTWMKYKPWFSSASLLFMRHPGVEPNDLVTAILKEHGSAQLATADVDRSTRESEAWEWAKVHEVPRLVKTRWYLLLDPSAVATSGTDWLQPELFDEDPEQGPIAFAACQWGYTKPADAYRKLDDWADGVSEFQAFPRLNWPYDPQSDRLHHEAISSWAFLANRDWAQAIADITGASLPCRDHATFSLFCAARSGKQWRRIAAKQAGWDHSFGWDDSSLAKRCAQVLRTTG
ncbi:MAG: hypothetical protein KDA90_15050 [Planctomycetaceae bacterium]|nr:hypothetical protein [Planctomycetaceae bacterium]